MLDNVRKWVSGCVHCQFGKWHLPLSAYAAAKIDSVDRFEIIFMEVYSPGYIQSTRILYTTERE